MKGSVNLKTLNRKKSEELFYRIQNLKNEIQNMAGAVQNPDFVTEENAMEIYDSFLLNCIHLKTNLNHIIVDVREVYEELTGYDLN